MYSLFGLIPAFFWGINPTIVGKIKAKPIQQEIGTAIGAFIFAIIVFLSTLSTSIKDLTSEHAPLLIGMATLSGFLWAIGQLLQYESFTLMDTSKAFALSTGFNLILNGLISVIVFKDWNTPLKLSLGICSIIVVILGAVLISYRKKKEDKENNKGLSKFTLGVIVTALSSAGLVGYSLVPRFATDSADIGPTSILLPQAIAMFVGALFLALLVYLKDKYNSQKDSSYVVINPFTIKTIQGILPGLLFAGANIGLIYGNALGSSAVCFTLGQLSVAISTVCSLIFLKEYKGKTKKELSINITGVVLILAGCIMTGFTM